MAGIAAGLAVSVKLPLLAPVGAIAVGMVLVSGARAAADDRRGDRRSRPSSSAATGTCGRRSTPAATRSRRSAGGRCTCRAPTRCRSTRGRASPSPTTCSSRRSTARWFFPQLDNALGPLWPLILIVAVAAAVFIVGALAQLDPAGARRRGAAHRRRLHRHAADRGRPGGLADRLLHQHPLPDARPAPGADAAADRATAAGARDARLADPALPRRRLRDHGADHAALVPGLHRRHGLPHPGAGLGAGGLGVAASPASRHPRLRRDRRRSDPAARRRARPRPGGPVLQAALQAHHPVPAGRRAAGGLRLRPRPARQADRHRRLGRDLLRPVRLLRRQPRQLRPVHRRRGAARGPTGWRPPAAGSAAWSTRATTTT